MNPKEKADKIFSEMYKAKDPLNSYPMCFDTAKQCSLIAVDEIIDQWEYIDVYLADGRGELNHNLKYWYEVKKQILAL